jgi:flagellin-like hook-associated protein FlgL
MQEIQDMLSRMKYLATQSANGTYDNDVDRKALQDEVDQMNAKIDRIADSANFNGIKLLDGSLAGGAVNATGATLLGKNIVESSAPETAGAAAKTDLSTNKAVSATAIDTFRQAMLKTTSFQVLLQRFKQVFKVLSMLTTQPWVMSMAMRSSSLKLTLPLRLMLTVA